MGCPDRLLNCHSDVLLVPMDNSTKALVALTVALFCISGLFFYVGTVKPLKMAPGDIALDDEGKLVQVEGIVADPYLGDRATNFELVDPSSGDHVTVFIGFNISAPLRTVLVSGATVKVQGKVTEYKQRPEIEVQDAGGIKVLAPPAKNEIAFGTIYGNKEVFDNMTVSLTGIVETMKFSWGDLNITISSGQFDALCRISGFLPQVPFKEGSKVSIVGQVWYDDEGKLHLKAKGWQALTVDD
jgi:hypothetical protein